MMTVSPSATALRPGEPAGVRSRRKRGFRSDIQGLRALAIGLVALYHAGVPGIPGGFVGVDVFFVISGFLITGLLVREIDEHGRVSLAGFYARRVRRILPAATAVLLVVTAAAVLVLPRTRWDDTAGHVIGSATSVVNWLFAANAVDYLDAGDAPSALQHYWSLAVEEQFYVVWPLVLIGVVALARSRRVRVTRGLLAAGALAVVAPSFAWSVVYTAENPAAAYFVTTTRLWELGVGAMLAIAAPLLLRLPATARQALGWAGLAAVVLAAVAFSTSTDFPGVAALLPTLGAAAIIAAGLGGGASRGAGALLSTRALTRLGDISYSLYLWHWPLLVLAGQVIGDLDAVQGLLIVVAAILPASLSYRFVEKPFQRSPLLGRTSRALLAGFALTVVSVVAGLALLAASTVAPAGAQGPTLAAPAPEGTSTTAGEAVIPDDVVGFTPSAVEAAQDNPSVYDEGCHLPVTDTAPRWCTYGSAGGDITVALVGDSHAASWAPALQTLAEERGWQLRTATKSSCPLADAEFVVGTQGEPYPQCDAWHDALLDELTAMRPDLVVTSSLDYAPVVDGAAAEGARATDLLGSAYGRSWGALGSAGIPVVAIVDTPAMGTNVPDCVSANPADIDRCAVNRATALEGNGDAQRRGAETARNTTVVDLNDQLCTADVCPPVIDGVLVYRDTQHLTATFSRTLAGALGAHLDAAGVLPPR